MMIRELDAWRRKVSALRSASASRLASEQNTTHVNAGGFRPSASLRTVPPHPISRSSQCAPRHRTCRIGSCSSGMLSMVLDGAPRRAPHRPRHLAARVQIVELLFVLEGVHAGPEASVLVREESVPLDQPAEGCLDELLARVHHIEDVSPEDEEPSIDPEAGIVGGLDACHPATVVGLNHMKRRGWTDAEKTRRCVTAADVVHVGRQMQVGQAIRIVGHEEVVAVVEIWLHRLEALAEIRMEPRVDERDLPVVDVAPQELDILPAL